MRMSRSPSPASSLSSTSSSSSSDQSTSKADNNENYEATINQAAMAAESEQPEKPQLTQTNITIDDLQGDIELAGGGSTVDGVAIKRQVYNINLQSGESVRALLNSSNALPPELQQVKEQIERNQSLPECLSHLEDNVVTDSRSEVHITESHSSPAIEIHDLEIPSANSNPDQNETSKPILERTRRSISVCNEGGINSIESFTKPTQTNVQNFEVQEPTVVSVTFKEIILKIIGSRDGSSIPHFFLVIFFIGVFIVALVLGLHFAGQLKSGTTS